MAPKKGQKMSLNAFLEDSTLGSWADEMDSLPSAPAQKTDEERARANERGFDRSNRDYGTRPERAGPPREELPLPTEPPYTAFVGNLPFDLTEEDLGAFFESTVIKSVKIIKDRDEKPKGFGYVEFDTLDGLKDGLAKSGSIFHSRTVRISVAAPPTQRQGFGDDEKTSGPWRRDGPLPDRQSPHSRFEDGDRGSRFREDRPPSQAETTNDWRSSRPAAPPPRLDDRDGPRPPPRRSGLATPSEPTAADTADDWTIGSKFKAAAPADAPPRGRFGSIRTDREGFNSPGGRPPSNDGPTDWRSAMRPPRQDSQEKSPSSSGPPTPQLARRKLELIPRSTSQGNSAANSPLSSPKIPHATAHRPNPFGAAKPVDVSAREQEIAEKVQKDREEIAAKVVAEKTPMARSSSKTAVERSASAGQEEPTATSPTSPTIASKPPPVPVSIVRPTFSFASAAAAKALSQSSGMDIPEVVDEEEPKDAPPVDEVTEKFEEMVV